MLQLHARQPRTAPSLHPAALAAWRRSVLKAEVRAERRMKNTASWLQHPLAPCRTRRVGNGERGGSSFPSLCAGEQDAWMRQAPCDKSRPPSSLVGAASQTFHRPSGHAAVQGCWAHTHDHNTTKSHDHSIPSTCRRTAGKQRAVSCTQVTSLARRWHRGGLTRPKSGQIQY